MAINIPIALLVLANRGMIHIASVPCFVPSCEGNGL